MIFFSLSDKTHISGFSKPYISRIIAYKHNFPLFSASFYFPSLGASLKNYGHLHTHPHCH